MSHISLRQIEHFVAVVEEESITRAAQRLHISPGAVSLSLRQLEESLGIQLTLRRRGQGVTITPAGHWMFEKSRQVQHDITDMMQAAQVMRGELVGPLRIGCYLTLSPWLLPRIAQHFAHHHPGVRLNFVEGGSAELQDQLSTGRLDAALVYENHLRDGFEGRTFTRMRLQAVFSPRHPLAHQERVALRDLEHDNAILLDMQPSIDRVEGIFRAAGCKLNILWRSSNVETIRSMVARGLGYAILMGRPYGDYTYDGLPLIYREIADPVPYNNVVVATPGNATTTAKLDELIRYCQAEFGGTGSPR